MFIPCLVFIHISIYSLIFVEMSCGLRKYLTLIYYTFMYCYDLELAVDCVLEFWCLALFLLLRDYTYCSVFLHPPTSHSYLYVVSVSVYVEKYFLISPFPTTRPLTTDYWLDYLYLDS